ncbi:multidrug resistance efflux transporter family protein [Pedobacter metabolipauper]|uniref:multidrug resistance efflux transporter family protein n=1 Tax=Pedobacter metabolipauper TaxID=425513 RepID=UPI00105CB28B|nr:multidrug resistance efflux transporter family protein [Pedobacter metabolipauper]
MALDGGSWIWSASLRFYWMLPFLLLIVWYRGGLGNLICAIKKDFLALVVWSTVGLDLFYGPLTYSATFSPPWLLASTWQFTIVAGMIVAPLIATSKVRPGVLVEK